MQIKLDNAYKALGTGPGTEIALNKLYLEVEVREEEKEEKEKE